MAQEHFIAQFRQRTGLTQTALAALLHVNRSHLNMNEQGQRILPAEASLRLVQLHQMLDDTAFVAQAESPKPTAAHKEKLQQQLLQHAAQLRYKAAMIEKKIAAYQKAEEQRSQRRVLLAAMKQSHLQQTPAPQEARWLAMQEKFRSLDYDYKPWEAEVDTFNRLRYRMLLLEADEAEKMVGEVDNSLLLVR